MPPIATKTFSGGVVAGGLAATLDRAFPSRSFQKSARLDASAINPLRSSVFVLSLGALSACSVEATTPLESPLLGEEEVLRADPARTNEQLLTINDNSAVTKREFNLDDYFLGEGFFTQYSSSPGGVDFESGRIVSGDSFSDVEFEVRDRKLIIEARFDTVSDLVEDVLFTITITATGGESFSGQATQALTVLFRNNSEAPPPDDQEPPDEPDFRANPARANELILTLNEGTKAETISARINLDDYFLGDEFIGTRYSVSPTYVPGENEDGDSINVLTLAIERGSFFAYLVISSDVSPADQALTVREDVTVTITVTATETGPFGDGVATQKLRIFFNDTDGSGSGAGAGEAGDEASYFYAEPKKADNFIEDSGSGLVVAGTSAEGEILEGSARDDRIGSIGTGDVALGGSGDDVLALSAVDFERLDGGSGTDTLAFGGSGMALDLSALEPTEPKDEANRVENIEIIDLTGSGDNTLTLSELAVRALTESGQVTLTIGGDEGDVLRLKEGIGDGDGQWQAHNNGTLYTLNGAVLAVDAAIDVVDIA